jgi:hypothetical protein
MPRKALVLVVLPLLLAGGCGESEDMGPGQGAAGQMRQPMEGHRAQMRQRAAMRHARQRARMARRHHRRAMARRHAAMRQLRAEEAEAAAAAEEASACDPNYAGACLDPNAYDYDCAGGSGDGPDYTGTVTVVGEDHYGLDADGDGVGCESGG